MARGRRARRIGEHTKRDRKPPVLTDTQLLNLLIEDMADLLREGLLGKAEVSFTLATAVARRIREAGQVAPVVPVVEEGPPIDMGTDDER